MSFTLRFAILDASAAFAQERVQTCHNYLPSAPRSFLFIPLGLIMIECSYSFVLLVLRNVALKNREKLGLH